MNIFKKCVFNYFLISVKVHNLLNFWSDTLPKKNYFTIISGKFSPFTKGDGPSVKHRHSVGPKANNSIQKHIYYLVRIVRPRKTIPKRFDC